MKKLSLEELLQIEPAINQNCKIKIMNLNDRVTSLNITNQELNF